MKKALVTGAAGFIGFHLVNKLVQDDYEVIGLDNINEYYDVNLKYARLEESGIERQKIKEVEDQSFNHSIIQSSKHPNYRFIKLDLIDKENLIKLFEKERFDYVVNLAAQAGVRYSLINPDSYINSNILGFYNILEACRKYPPKHLLFASSSSVYGLNEKVPFSTKDNVGHPISLYAATKRSNELLAHTYSHLFDIPVTGLRFFTVYGPWGRPDMAYYSFTEKILKGEEIEVFNNGNLERDFTYIDDIIEGIIKLINMIPEKENKIDSLDSSKIAKFKLYNIGNSEPVKLMDFIHSLENVIGEKARLKFTEMQKGDVLKTYADISQLQKITNFSLKTELKTGLSKFFGWYKRYSLYNK
jgi:UDP-glucuronate 4-epimerase